MVRLGFHFVLVGPGFQDQVVVVVGPGFKDIVVLVVGGFVLQGSLTTGPGFQDQAVVVGLGFKDFFLVLLSRILLVLVSRILLYIVVVGPGFQDLVAVIVVVVGPGFQDLVAVIVVGVVTDLVNCIYCTLCCCLCQCACCMFYLFLICQFDVHPCCCGCCCCCCCCWSQFSGECYYLSWFLITPKQNLMTSCVA